VTKNVEDLGPPATFNFTFLNLLPSLTTNAEKSTKRRILEIDYSQYEEEVERLLSTNMIHFGVNNFNKNQNADGMSIDEPKSTLGAKEDLCRLSSRYSSDAAGFQGRHGFFDFFFPTCMKNFFYKEFPITVMTDDNRVLELDNTTHMMIFVRLILCLVLKHAREKTSWDDPVPNIMDYLYVEILENLKYPHEDLGEYWHIFTETLLEKLQLCVFDMSKCGIMKCDVREKIIKKIQKRANLDLVKEVCNYLFVTKIFEKLYEGDYEISCVKRKQEYLNSLYINNKH